MKQHKPWFDEDVYGF